MDEAGEFAAATVFLRNCLVLACHYLVNEFAYGRSGAVGDTKNCGSDSAEARDHASRRRECRRDVSAVWSGQRFVIGEQHRGTTSDNGGMPHDAGRQRFWTAMVFCPIMNNCTPIMRSSWSSIQSWRPKRPFSSVGVATMATWAYSKATAPSRAS